MVYVVLRTGKVLKYNDVTHVMHTNGMVDLLTGNDARYLVAKIPSEIIERVEFFRPCKVMKEKSLRKITKTY